MYRDRRFVRSQTPDPVLAVGHDLSHRIGRPSVLAARFRSRETYPHSAFRRDPVSPHRGQFLPPDRQPVLHFRQQSTASARHQCNRQAQGAVFHEIPRSAFAPLQPEPGLTQSVLEILADHLHLIMKSLLKPLHEPAGQGRKNKIGYFGCYADADHFLGTQRVGPDIHPDVDPGGVR